MNDARQLKIRIAIILASSGVLGAFPIASCGGGVTVEGSASSSTSTSAGAGGAGGGATSTASTGMGGAPPSCMFGSPKQECYTLDQLEQIINHPPQGGDVSDGGTDAGDGGIMLTDCADRSLVQNGCCNPAVAGPEKQAGLCCYWFCEGACCGRAFTVEGHARVAGVVERDGWSAAPLDPGSIDIDPGTQAALVSAWLADAQMEHASIASFARFTLELLALGAPAELVAASQRASLDEIEHARLCFGLASRFGGRSFGPLPLDVAGALRGTSLAESAAWAVREGCVGETLATLLARAQLARAVDGGVRGALARIAEDEEGHAALAWRFVAWALSSGGAPVQAAVARAFEESKERLRSMRADRGEAALLDQAAWHRFGRLTPAEIDSVTREALDEVILPCAQALLPAPPPAVEIEGVVA